MRRQLSIRNLTPWQIFIRSAVICALTGSVLASLSLKKIERYPLSAAPSQFNGQKSYDYMTKLAKGYPNRLPWHANRKHAAVWIKDQLRSMGYVPKGMPFSS